ncbi:hypothetical protein HYPSUDRAFT_41719 [Hypholoma sublateritium FD-334 SS-4]|uniref:Uncharacterized protein n=1 Tax=Hypholoma sublateritium (strain FD-334 SS-4) TaxID=945553 RepID=A0A0D2PNY4_HYPSF|nr:hypothetical protein HYPSUDRAFT_41719 [Hypholoma sublateritium FD-334 SS-4]
MPSRYAVYSGHAMSLETFQKLVVTLNPDYADAASLLQFYSGYNTWSLHIVAKADRRKVPMVLMNPIPGAASDSISAETIKEMVFPVRYVPYTSEQQLLQSDENRHLWEENDLDRAKRDAFFRLLASYGATPEETLTTGFVCVKDSHPDYMIRSF